MTDFTKQEKKAKEILNTIPPYKTRGFEIVEDNFRKHPDHNVLLPLRGTSKSAGYDFYSNENTTIKPGEKHLFWTDIKSYMMQREVLEIYVRSSIAIKKDLNLCNQVGIIDMDYFSNESNDGNIGICLRNVGINEIKIEKGERIAQGIFKSFLESDNCNSKEERTGGIGHTNK
jgi:dUTP pyrophosphatase